MRGFLLRRTHVGILLLTVAFLTTSCFFPTSLEVDVSEFEGEISVSISVGSNWLPCSNDPEDPDIFDCTYFYTDREGNREISRFTLSELELGFLLLFYDPLVLQVPQTASNFQASYFEQGGSGGSLVITSGLDSIPVDATRTLQAEPGMQLVILDFPSDAPASGKGGFNVNFRIPDNLTSLDIKALFTGKVTAGGETYYVPIFPCTSDISALPNLSVPLPEGGTVNLPVDQVSGCDNVVYNFGDAPQFNTVLLLPLVAK